jgi:hypothetical protein
VPERVFVLGLVLPRQIERRRAVEAFAVDAKRLLARCQDAETGRRLEQRFGRPSNGGAHMLAIVEHKEQALAAKRRGESLSRPLSIAGPQPERRRDGAGREGGIRERRQLGEPDAIGEFRQQAPRDLERKPRLADAAAADQRHHAMARDERRQLLALALAADEVGDRGGKIGRRRRIRHLAGRRRQSGRGVCRQRANRAREAIAAQGDGENEVAVSAECPAQRRDLDLDVVLFDHRAGPDLVQQGLLRHQLAPRFEQHHQHVEGARPELDQRSVSEQLALPRQHPEPAEREAAFHRFG